MASLPSPVIETEIPCQVFPIAPAPTNLFPCWLQTPPLLDQIQAAPTEPLSSTPPTMAVLPSPESERENPCSAAPTAPEPTSFGPCWLQRPPFLVHTHTAPR